MTRLFALAALILTASAATAFAAAKSGTYAGTSKGRYIQIGQAEEPTDKGKVTFKVSKSKVLNFKVRKQLFQCGPPAEVPVTVAKIALNGKGKGSAIYQDPNVGPLKVTIKVTSEGKASGKVVRPSSGAGLCNPDYPVTFTAKAG